MSKFSFDSIQDFDNHISSSILGYDILHSLIVNISSFFIKTNVVPVDLGCTSGKLIKSIENQYKCHCIGYDIIDSNFDQSLDLRVQDITDESFLIPETNIIYILYWSFSASGNDCTDCKSNKNTMVWNQLTIDLSLQKY